MSILEKFKAEVQAYIEQSGMPRTEFGIQAMGDRAFVFQLMGKRGRVPTVDTVDKVRAWMANNPPKPNGKAE